MHSLLLDPGPSPHDGIALRRFITRWLGPAILAPRVATVIGRYADQGVGGG